MKFVTLALVTLLALGCHAASLQADAPSGNELAVGVQHARKFMDEALKQISDSLHNIAGKITNEETKTAFIAKIDALMDQIKALREQGEPMTNAAVQAISEATAQYRQQLQDDIEALKTQMGDQPAVLRKTLEDHFNDYQSSIMPAITEYQAIQQQQMAEWKAKVEPLMAEMRAKFETNVEDTKSKLIPMIEMVKAKISERFGELQESFKPYIEDYREQMMTSIRSAKEADTQAIYGKIQPHLAELKAAADKFVAAMKTVIDGQ